MHIRSVLSRFDGRINRAKFWAGYGIAFAIVAGLVIIGSIIDQAVLSLHLLSPLSTEKKGLDFSGFFLAWELGVVLLWIYMVLALSIKRLHDRDKSGWWYLICFVPLVGPIWLLVELGMLGGTHGINRFGPDPLDSRA